MKATVAALFLFIITDEGDWPRFVGSAVRYNTRVRDLIFMTNLRADSIFPIGTWSLLGKSDRLNTDMKRAV